jgi:aspartate carbamoyltransferase regulatory subunit
MKKLGVATLNANKLEVRGVETTFNQRKNEEETKVFVKETITIVMGEESEEDTRRDYLKIAPHLKFKKGEIIDPLSLVIQEYAIDGQTYYKVVERIKKTEAKPSVKAG